MSWLNIKLVVGKFFKFFGLLLIYFFFFFAILRIFYEFNLISGTVLLIVTLSLSFLFDCLTILIGYLVLEQKIKIPSFLQKNNFTKLVPICLLLFLFAQAIKKDVYFDTNLMICFLSLQWGIFAISAAIFGIWIASARNQKETLLSETKKCETFTDLLKIIDIQYNRGIFIDAIYSIIFLMFDILLLCITTGLFYIVFHGEVNLVIQCLSIFSCYVSTNSLISVFIDVLFPVLTLRKEVKKKYYSTDTNKIAEDLLIEMKKKIKNNKKDANKPKK